MNVIYINIHLKIITDKQNLSMNHIELEDLVYTYPEQQQPGFQTLISAKEEFRKTASGAAEPVPRRGELFKHQGWRVRRSGTVEDVATTQH